MPCRRPPPWAVPCRPRAPARPLTPRTPSAYELMLAREVVSRERRQRELERERTRALRDLIQATARQLLSPEHGDLLSLLLDVPGLSEEELVSVTGLARRQCRAILGHWRSLSLLQDERGPNLRVCWHIDTARFPTRILELQRSMLRQASDQQAHQPAVFCCPRADRDCREGPLQYDDAAALQVRMRCPSCRAPLEEQAPAINVRLACLAILRPIHTAWEGVHRLDEQLATLKHEIAAARRTYEAYRANGP